MMTAAPEEEDPGFETDVNELDHRKDNGSERSLEEKPADTPDSADPEGEEMEHVQEDAAEDRKEGGYQ